MKKIIIIAIILISSVVALFFITVKVKPGSNFNQERVSNLGANPAITYTQNEVDAKTFTRDDLSLSQTPTTKIDKKKKRVVVEKTYTDLEFNGNSYEEVEKTLKVGWTTLYYDSCIEKTNGIYNIATKLGFSKEDIDRAYSGITTEQGCKDFMSQSVNERVSLEEANLVEEMEALKSGQAPSDSIDISDLIIN